MNNLLDQFIYRVTMAAEAEHYHLLTFIQPQEDAERVYDELISTNRVDGFILSDVRYDDPRIARLVDLDAPFVGFRRHVPARRGLRLRGRGRKKGH